MKLSLRLLLPYISFLLSALSFLAASPARAGVATGASPWTYSSLSYRREVQLPADPSRSRTNVPVFLDLKPLGPIDLTTVKVEDITGNSATACSPAVYAQPSGRDPRAFWLVGGTVSAGQVRRFLIYYNKLSQAAAYAFNPKRSGGSTALSYALTIDASKYHYTLKSDRVEFMRTAHDITGAKNPQASCFYEQNSGFFEFKDLKSGFNPLAGIRMSYAFYGAAFTDAYYFNVSGAERNFDAIQWDRNGPTIAMSAHYTIKDIVAHKTEVTHRIFQSLPLLEYSVTATPNSGELLNFSNDIFHSRQFFWDSSSYTPVRMLTDLNYDGRLTDEAKTKKWVILADSGNHAFGVFTFKPSTKRKMVSTHSLQEYNDLASEQGSIFVYYGTGTVDELHALFDTMKRGCTLGLEQQQQFTIVQPAEGDHVITGETVTVVVSGAGIKSDLSLRVDYPGGTYTTLRPTGVAGSSNTFNLGVVGAASKFGTWTLTASSGGVQRVRKISVLNPDHPRVLFTASELTKIRARWLTNSHYQTHIQKHLVDSADGVLKSAPPPAVLPDDEGPRGYGRNLLDLAGALLMDPSATAYRTRMWSDFKTMMAWPQWDPVTNNCSYLSGDDTEEGEALQSLAIVYDWYYSDLTVAERRKYGQLLARFADAMMENDLANIYYPRWSNFNSIDNSRSVSQSAAISGVDRAVGPEIPDSRHSVWRTRLDLNFSNLKTVLCTDGSYNAGESYHGLLLWYLFFWSETRRLNGDTSLYTSNAWFRAMPDYVLYGLMPGRVGNFGGLLSFGNCDPEPYYSLQTDLALPSLRAGNGTAQWIADNIGYIRVEPYQAIWQNYALPETDPATQPNWHFFNRRGIFVFRTSWNNDAMYFATKCGEFWGGHEHPDLGTFVLHRNGYPYIAAPLYVDVTNPEDENILLANGKRPQGSHDMYSDPTDPRYWGKTLRALGSPEYFNVLQDPTASYEDGSNLKTYNREFVGFGDMIVLRDTITASAASEFHLMFHGYKTNPQTEAGTPYDPNDYPTAQIFEKQSAASRVRLYPNKTASPSEWLTIQDLSRNAWTTNIGAWMLDPSHSSDGSEGSSKSGSLKQRGSQLTRVVTGATSARALQLFHFRSDSFAARSWDSSVADDGLVLYYGALANKDDRIKVVWPKGGRMANVTGAEGLTVTGAMAMRNYENKDFGGRDLTLLRDDSAKGEKTVLASSTVPITLASRTASGRGEAWIACDAAAKVTLYCPKKFQSATFNGQAVAVTGSGTQQTFAIPATPLGGKLELHFYQSAGAKDGWNAYQNAAARNVWSAYQ